MAKNNEWESFFQKSHDRFIFFWLHFLEENATAYDRLEADEENIRSAWVSAAKKEDEVDLLQALEPLHQFYQTKGRISQGEKMFATAVSHLTELDVAVSDSEALPARQQLIGRLMAHQAWFQSTLAHFTQAESLANQAWTLITHNFDQQYLAFLLLVKANIALYKYGEAIQAQEFSQSSYEMYQALDDQRGMVISLINLGLSYSEVNEYKKAVPYLKQAISICHEQEDISFNILFAQSINNLGLTYEGLGQYTAANASYLECFKVCEQLQNKIGMAFSLANQSQIALRLGFFPEAKKLSQQQLEISQTIGNQGLYAGGLADLGNAYYMLGEFDLAWESLQKGIEIATITKIKPLIVQNIAQFARLLYHLGQDDESLSLLTIIKPYSLPHRHLGNPEKLYELLTGELSADKVQSIEKEWQGKELSEAVEFIQSLENIPV